MSRFDSMNVLDNQQLLNSALDGLVGSTCLITGGTGFIGRHLVRRLSTVSGIKIRVLAGSVDDPRIPRADGVQPIQGRLLDTSALTAALRDVDHVFHLAGLTRAKNERQFQSVNGTATGSLAELALCHAPDLRSFCYVSSLAATGPSKAGITVNESHPRQPITAYGRSKARGEELIEQLNDLPSTTLRPPAVYGPGEKDLFQLFRLVARGVAPQIGWRTRHYSFVYVDDLIDALIISAATQSSAKRTFFVAPLTSETGRRFVESIESGLNRTAWKPPLPSPLLLIPAAFGSLMTPFLSRPPLLNLDRWRDLAQTSWVCDAGSLLKEVGYASSTSLEAGVRQTIAAARASGELPPA